MTSENIVGKEETAGNQHFFLFPPCFLYYKRQGINYLFCYIQPFPKGQILDSKDIKEKSENAGFQHFIPFMMTFYYASRNLFVRVWGYQ